MSDFEKYKSRGLVSLKNLGNTCFLNSCIQLLAYTHELTELLSQTPDPSMKVIERDTGAAVLMQEYKQLMHLYWSLEQPATIEPTRFIRIVAGVALEKKIIEPNAVAQHDMSEFLVFILNCIHSVMAAPAALPPQKTAPPDPPTDDKCAPQIAQICAREYSPIMDLFYGITTSSIYPEISMECAPLSVAAEFFLTLNLSIPAPAADGAPPTLYDCLDNFICPEILDGENKWYNEDTGTHEPVIKKYNFWRLPPILIVCLKRFCPATHQKNMQLVVFPENLYFCNNVPSASCDGGGGAQYELYGVGNHIGNSDGGHYTAFVKNATTKQWLHFNDEVIQNVPREQVVSPMAYCLFYRKIS